MWIKPCLCPCVAERASRRAGTVGRAKCVRHLFFRFLVAFPPRYLVRELALATTPPSNDLSAAPPPGRSDPSSSSSGVSNTQDSSAAGGRRASSSGASAGLYGRRRSRESLSGTLSCGRRCVVDVLVSPTVDALTRASRRAAAKFVR